MGVCVELLDGSGSPVRLPDVQGGFFNAAGDFDDLLSLTESMTLPVLSRVDPYRTVAFGRQDMSALLTDLQTVLPHARAGREARGLARLIALAQECARRDDGQLVFVGD